MKFKSKQLMPFGLELRAESDEVNLSDIPAKVLHELVMQNHLLVFRGFKTFSDVEGFSQYCEQWGEISVWPFGKVLNLIAHENPQDHIFDHSYVPLHWDGMYRRQVPELQIFHCVNAPLPERGGRTSFSQTAIALQRASVEDKNLWRKVTGIYERKMEFYHSKIVSPIINKHPYRDFEVIRYNEPETKAFGRFINPPLLEFIGLEADELEYFHTSLKTALYANENFYAHCWQDGDVVVADNFTLLHGRESFTLNSARYLQRVHILSQPPFQNPGLQSFK